MSAEIRAWRAKPRQGRAALIDSCSDAALAWLDFNAGGWWARARESQLAPAGDEWGTWLILAGRGWGKTLTGAEWVRDQVESGGVGRLAFIAKDPGEARDVMIEGVSGILSISPPWFRPRYEPSKKRLEWPNGAVANVFSSAEPDELRGPEIEKAWVDEFAKYRIPDQRVVWDNLQFSLRLGQHPQVCITTTPRPTAVLREIVADPYTVVTKGSSYENIGNVSPRYRRVIERYAGTRLGRQEIEAEILEDTPGALWSLGLIDRHRLRALPAGVVLVRAVVGVDPQARSRKEAEAMVTEEEDATETGIVVAGLGSDGHAYVLEDRSTSARPREWAAAALGAYHDHAAGYIIGEANQGGEMVEEVIAAQDRTAAVKLVYASKGKVTRAEPIALRYEKGEVHHIGSFHDLEDQMTTWVPGLKSPDRMDALVWALSELFGTGHADLDAAFVAGKLSTAEEFPA